MEYITFNKCGQWELHKGVDEPYKVFGGNAKEGELHEDHGRRGSLHNYGGGKRPKAGRINWDNAGKPAHRMESATNERNPGVGD